MHVSRSNTLLCVLFLAGAAIGAGAYFASKPREVHSAQLPAPVQKELAPESNTDEGTRLRQQIAALESSIAALRNQRAVPPSTPNTAAAAAPATPDSSSDARRTLDEMEAEQERAEKQLFSRIGDRFAAQPVDSGWSASMTARITSQIADLGPQSARVDGIECRSSSCRIEISNYDEESREGIRNKLRFGLGDVLGTGAITRDEGGRTFIYLAKDPEALGIGAAETQP
jgi:hypothetical protein